MTFMTSQTRPGSTISHTIIDATSLWSAMTFFSNQLPNLHGVLGGLWFFKFRSGEEVWLMRQLLYKDCFMILIIVQACLHGKYVTHPMLGKWMNVDWCLPLQFGDQTPQLLLAARTSNNLASWWFLFSNYSVFRQKNICWFLTMLNQLYVLLVAPLSNQHLENCLTSPQNLRSYK